MTTTGIIHVSAYYPPHLGGQEIAVHDLVVQLALTGTKVDVVTSNLDSRAGVSIENGVRVTRLRSVEFGHSAIIGGLFFWLLRHTKRDTIVHLHVGQFFVSEIVWLASKIKRFKYIIHMHGYPVQSGPMGRLLPLYKMLFFRREIHDAKVIVVLNSDHRRIIRSDHGYSGRLLVMCNGIDESFYEVMRTQDEPQPCKLLFVGRLSPGKNLVALVEAVGTINHHITLDIIGDGECRHRLEMTIKEKGLNNVTLHGKLSRDEIRQFYARASAVILPSLYEGQPMVLLEAMASRVPIIVTKGICMELEDREAILIEPTNQGIADGIENFLAMSPEAIISLTDAGFKRAVELRWGQLIHSYLELYAEVSGM